MMEQKSFSRVTYVMTPLESPHMWKPTMRNQGKTPWIFLMKNGSWQQLSRLSTNKTYDAIIAVESNVGLSRKVIWCSNLYRKRMECTNYLLHGKDRLWSERTSTMDPTT